MKKIMIAVDGSLPGRRAAEMGVSLAELAAGEVTAVYVVDVARLAHLPGYTAIPGLKEGLLKLMQSEGEKATGEVEDLAREAGVAYHKLIAEGSPGDELLRASQELGMDLIVMGSIGKSGLDKFLLGSVAEKVVRHSKVPVLLVPVKG